MDTPEQAARRIFGRRATMYTTSDTHTDPQVLARVVDLSRPERKWIVLDVGTGTGHTAFALAPHVHSVIGVDLTGEMLAEAVLLRSKREMPNVEFALADVHALPFEDDAFDLVTCRRAAHHFSDIMAALGEMRRVLRAGGRMVIDDRSVPEDGFIDACMNELDLYHDESHVRQYRPGEWRRMVEQVGLVVGEVEPYMQHRPLTSLTKGVSPENVERIHAVLEALDDGQRQALDLFEVDGQPYSNHWYVMVAATLPSGRDPSDAP